ncbi:uncharacterized protein MONBRDRAFT_4724 [Monosiga brevicollis MX1]|uniref:Uncharacterized protein n=1 Tax=Monosiga brevicollis TaxID=81824 RepID=A9UNR1_MONBE|nr:uncharacterized protein MONBRDRAFT_4724 [Monosiga brevicollis MX1]EDQ92288.1 predicted protein [Monosiga brevicollis MX1]|eukprot:XP_001742050.1 hypothetical protein [Monosiga brevicollis MX1]
MPPPPSVRQALETEAAVDRRAVSSRRRRLLDELDHAAEHSKVVTGGQTGSTTDMSTAPSTTYQRPHALGELEQRMDTVNAMLDRLLVVRNNGSEPRTARPLAAPRSLSHTSGDSPSRGTLAHDPAASLRDENRSLRQQLEEAIAVLEETRTYLHRVRRRDEPAAAAEHQRLTQSENKLRTLGTTVLAEAAAMRTLLHSLQETLREESIDRPHATTSASNHSLSDTRNPHVLYEGPGVEATLSENRRLRSQAAAATVLLKQHRELQDAQASIRQDYGTARERIRELEQAVQAAHQQTEQWRSRATALEESVDLLKSDQLRFQTETTQALENSLQEAESYLERYEHSVGEAKHLRSELLEARDKMEEMMEDLRHNQAQQEHLQSTIAAAQDDLRDRDRTIAQLKLQLETDGFRRRALEQQLEQQRRLFTHRSPRRSSPERPAPHSPHDEPRFAQEYEQTVLDSPGTFHLHELDNDTSAEAMRTTQTYSSLASSSASVRSATLTSLDAEISQLKASLSAITHTPTSSFPSS